MLFLITLEGRFSGLLRGCRSAKRDMIIADGEE